MNNQEQIKQYLNNEQLLFESWYKKEKASELGYEEDVEFKGALPSLEEIKMMFSSWLIDNKLKLQKLICIKFKYLEKKNDFRNAGELSIALAEVLAPDYANSVEISVILVGTSLDTLCQS